MSGRALLVGDAGGAVFPEIGARFKIIKGNGTENPHRFDMIIFDGANTTPEQLRSNPGVQNFLLDGKIVVILNDTEDQRSTGLAGLIWAHSEGDSPAVAFMARQDSSGIGQELYQIDFPVRLQSAVPGALASSPITPTSDELEQDSVTWLDALTQRASGAVNNIGPATIGQGQTVLNFHHVEPVIAAIPSVLNGQAAQFGWSWGPNGSEPPNASTTISGTFETVVNAMLEGNSVDGFEQKVFARQYLDISPPNPLPTVLISNQNPITGSSDAWNIQWPVFAIFGWNNSFNLATQLENAPILGVTENLPQAVNGVTQLTTSQSHTESVAVSVTGGIQNGNGLGTVGVSWSNSWTWGKASTVQFQDWESQSFVSIPTNQVSYQFQAVGGTDISASILNASLIDLPLNDGQLNSPPQNIPYPALLGPPSPPPTLNQLQTSAMTNQSETAWTTSPGDPVPPQVVGFDSTATIISGQVMNPVGDQGPEFPFGLGHGSGAWGLTSFTTTTMQQTFALDFDAPGLQPPAAAPWTLTFAAPVPSGSTWLAQGTLALSSAQPSDTPINLTYVIQPQTAMTTLPSTGVCAGNSETFAPGAGVISNDPLQVTIKQGDLQVPLSPHFEAVGTPYNVQIVAWLPSTDLTGGKIINPQAAVCVTVPSQQP